MDVTQKTLNTLFEQLGLPDDDASINAFIQVHSPLHANGPIWAEGFWTPAQAAFLKEAWEQDADWVEVVDELSALLHKQ